MCHLGRVTSQPQWASELLGEELFATECPYVPCPGEASRNTYTLLMRSYATHKQYLSPIHCIRASTARYRRQVTMEVSHADRVEATVAFGARRWHSEPLELFIASPHCRVAVVVASGGSASMAGLRCGTMCYGMYNHMASLFRLGSANQQA